MRYMSVNNIFKLIYHEKGKKHGKEQITLTFFYYLQLTKFVKLQQQTYNFTITQFTLDIIVSVVKFHVFVAVVNSGKSHVGLCVYVFVGICICK